MKAVVLFLGISGCMLVPCGICTQKKSRVNKKDNVKKMVENA